MASREVYISLDHYVQVIAKLYGSYVSPDGHMNGCLDVILPLALHRTYLFHIMVATSRLMQVGARGLPIAEDPTLLYHYGQCLTTLQEALSDADDDGLPLAIVQLISLEWRLGHTQALILHTRGLQRIMTLRSRSSETSPALKIVAILIRAASNTSVLTQWDERGKAAETSLVELKTFSAKEGQVAGQRYSCSPLASYGADVLLLDRNDEVDALPPGLREVVRGNLVSNVLVKTMLEVNKALRQGCESGELAMYSLSWAHWEHCLQVRITDGKSETILDRWLWWALLAFMYMCSDDMYRNTNASSIDQLVDMVVSHVDALEDGPEVDMLDMVEDKRMGISLYLYQTHTARACVIWSLMCVAGASEKRRKDAHAMSSQPERSDVVLDPGATKLMHKACMMLKSEKLLMQNWDGEWQLLAHFLCRFWCPGWLQKEWEKMYRKVSALGIPKATEG